MATSFNFQDFLAGLEDIGFYEVALPFLLVFTITFAILQKIKIFGPTGKNFNAVIAVVMAFLVVRTSAIVEVMNLFLPQISMISIIIVTTLLLIGILLNKENTSFTGALGGIGILLTLAGVVFAFITSSGALGWEIPSWLNFSSGDWNFIIGLGIFFLFFMYITSESDKDKKNPLWNWIKELPGDIGGKP
ncbi:MAG: hypothetical protein QT08_C0014G0041 [archaeon GW2011_AR17]|nr:MAG: hypothetical protein QT08_C0014G0041 [archaeon GW2011_AR17]MBS3154799.1 hypothetical protein [Candidatus Woesearchaeota archaeon]HIH15770.1 hypothetical protein [Nanoarchaeota archaeon]HIH58973.1 hypothetical protein [Nanoarchaeota archaeon]HII14350.1 hypothetical protein [Nanoarchaeota archaeon]